MPRITNIQIRRGSASDWASVNPTLASGEMALEIDTNKVKVGDGSTAWNSLRYLSVDGGNIDGGGAPSPTPTSTPVPPTATPTEAGVVGYNWSGGGGTFCPGSTVNGYASYTDGVLRLFYGGNGFWFIELVENYGGPPIAVAESSAGTPPLTGWNEDSSTLSTATCS